MIAASVTSRTINLFLADNVQLDYTIVRSISFKHKFRSVISLVALFSEHSDWHNVSGIDWNCITP